MMQPICPKCGSVKVHPQGSQGVCDETDCGYIAPWKSFKKAPLEPHYEKPCNTKWRDPVALSMDGYDE